MDAAGIVLQDDGERTALPLYTEAIKFFNHKDGMVRAAVRTLTLQMYGLQDDNIQQFLVSQPASNFFNEVAIIIAEHCQVSAFHLHIHAWLALH